MTAHNPYRPPHLQPQTEMHRPATRWVPYIVVASLWSLAVICLGIVVDTTTNQVTRLVCQVVIEVLYVLTTIIVVAFVWKRVRPPEP